MLNLKEIEKQIKETIQKIDFYKKFYLASVLIGIENLIDFENYLKIGD